MKIHRPLAEACVTLLNSVLEDGRVLDHEVAAAFRANRRWGKRDRHFIADSVWEVVRWRRALAHVAGSDEVEKLLAVVWRRNGYAIPEWWATLDEDVGEHEATLEAQPVAVRQSVPDWLDARGREELGEDWLPILEALNQRAPVFLRVNRLKSNRDTVLAWLESEDVAASAVDGVPDAIRLEGMLPKRLSYDSRIEIQDGGSQMIAPFLQVEPGMKVIDACAGAGGKTLHLAALMQGQGEVVALDVSQRRLDELWKRAKRAGLRNLKIERWDDQSLAKWRGWADRVLIDAPCSGLGTLRRQPDLKWSLTEARLAKVIRTQRRLLDHYPEMLREGGKFVYATCSVLPSENRGQVEALRERDPRWEMEDDHAVDPGTTGFDGFYMARLSKR
ncbi:RsmB/NOP family class I SAM-dependent RNA methyltransferase [Haloferula sp. A504]|uniref:RsmB/NOP family class I SAM-dependent RNA methyltransferase n=1 Tax=Haloferula sp. A504 TaxID=3373601 RepID=UPI0031C97262|nr:RsmB/NOP family class I SAM-dependent RNA methyltransferase [Verrucomicrobiaceae bacterium E54]